MDTRMKRLAAIAAAALLLTACGGNDTPTSETTAPATSTTSSSAPTPTSSVTPTPTETVESEPPTPEAQQQATVAEVAQDEPYVVECLEGTPGPALWSDGTKRHSQWCWETRGGAENAAAESAAGLVDPATIPIAQGGTCPAYKCGYGNDANGNRLPTSGEIQAKDGCDAGYITDPELCAAVANVKVP